MKWIIRIIKPLIVLTPLVVFGWLFVVNVVPSGIFLIKHSVHDTSPFIDALLTSERVLPPKKDVQGIWVQKIIADPVFFFLHPHRSFDAIEATIWFQNEKTPLVELGVLAAKDPERYVLEPLQNLMIDSSTWPSIREGKMILLQRETMYKSIADFYAHPPALGEISTYHADLNLPFRLFQYSPSKSLQTIPVTLRGTQEMKTYIKNETLNWVFSFMDMNRAEGADPVTVSVYNEQGELVSQQYTDDDGDVSTRAFPSRLRTLTMTVPNLPEGVYKIVVQASRDIFVRKIVTSQQKLIFLNSVYLGDEDGYHAVFSPVTFWTEGKRLSFQTRHAAGIQSVKVGKQTLAIEFPYKLFTVLVQDAGLVSATIAKGDVEVLSDAPVAFSSSQYFRPDPVRLTPHTDFDRLRINYILARYSPPLEKNGWIAATARFQTRDLLLDQGSWKMTFSTPEIAELGASVLVKEIDVKFIRAPFGWKDFWQAIRKNFL